MSAGELEEKYVTYLGQAETARETSAYQPYISMSHEKAKETLEHAEEFIAHVKELLAHKEKRDEENQA